MRKSNGIILEYFAFYTCSYFHLYIFQGPRKTYRGIFSDHEKRHNHLLWYNSLSNKTCKGSSNSWLFFSYILHRVSPPENHEKMDTHHLSDKHLTSQKILFWEIYLSCKIRKALSYRSKRWNLIFFSALICLRFWPYWVHICSNNVSNFFSIFSTWSDSSPSPRSFVTDPLFSKREDQHWDER